MILRIAIGVAYGAILLFGAFASIRDGGALLPAFLVAAPISFVPTLGLLAAPAWWGFAGWLSGRPGRWAFAIFMVVHTVSALAFLIYVLGVPLDLIARVPRLYFQELARRFPNVMWGTLAIYAVGQVAAWISLFTRRPAPSIPPRPVS